MDYKTISHSGLVELCLDKDIQLKDKETTIDRLLIIMAKSPEEINKISTEDVNQVVPAVLERVTAIEHSNPDLPGADKNILVTNAVKSDHPFTKIDIPGLINGVVGVLNLVGLFKH